MKTQTLILALALSALTAQAQDFPRAYKWLNNKEIAFSQDGSFTDSDGYVVTVGKKFTKTAGVNAPEKFADFPLQPEGAVNLTYSPDSTKLAFTRANNLWVVDIASGKETQLTTDGTRTVMNGYASWVYYEEILGRPSQYRAFWWSPDSQKLAFYHFDDTQVPMFPIYSPFGQDGKLRETHYPKVGEKNPDVRIGFADLQGNLTWADFNEKEDQYFGLPFWGADSRTFYVARMPRKQQTLDLYAVNAIDGDKKVIYHEEVPTWLDWMSEMLFDDKGLYMVRSFETLWQQIYFLSYDGATLKRLTDGPNWRIKLIRADKDGSVYFTAERDARVRSALYKVSAKGQITALTDPSLDVADVSFSPDGKYFLSLVSNLHTPYEIRLQETRKPVHSYTVAAFPAAQEGAQGELVSIVTDGLELPGIIYYPKDFDPAKRYPVHVDIYGGPDTPLVNDRWVPASRYDWYYRNGIIQLIADCRAAGHNGRAGTDAIYKQLSTVEVADFVAWARWLQSLPYVKPEKIGVEGFSFGGTMTALLVATASDAYHYGIAGGGVYDWRLYDSHYTERFMSTLEDNAEGYEKTAVVNRVAAYPAKVGAADTSVMLKLTHGTGDDNVHFQNTLQLIDVLHKQGARFEFMIYPDGMHGYRGYQGRHFTQANRDFWRKYLLEHEQ